MLDNQTINRLSDKINQLLPPGLQQVKTDFDAKLKTLLQQQLSEFEFVSREEFDIQSRILQRTRSKLEALEDKLKQLNIVLWVLLIRSFNNLYQCISQSCSSCSIKLNA